MFHMFSGRLCWRWVPDAGHSQRSGRILGKTLFLLRLSSCVSGRSTQCFELWCSTYCEHNIRCNSPITSRASMYNSRCVLHSHSLLEHVNCELNLCLLSHVQGCKSKRVRDSEPDRAVSESEEVFLSSLQSNSAVLSTCDTHWATQSIGYHSACRSGLIHSFFIHPFIDLLSERIISSVFVFRSRFWWEPRRCTLVRRLAKRACASIPKCGAIRPPSIVHCFLRLVYLLLSIHLFKTLIRYC